MQMDFHYYAVYVLCRCAGIKASASRIIAYASQQVDDAKYGHGLDFENGGHFQQVLTAHEFISPGVISKKTQYRIFAAFHFLPADGEGLPVPVNTERKFRERMLCLEDSDISHALLKHVKSLKNEPYFLHSLGIVLHTYADTFSHQKFSGLFSGFSGAGKINDANEVEVWNNRTSCFEPYSPEGSVFKRGMKKSLENFFLYLLNKGELIKLGHTQVFKLPDEPYRRWRYHHVYLDKDVEFKNWKLCMKASENIYAYLKEMAEYGCFNSDSVTEAVPWDDIAEPLLRAFEFEGTTEERCENWIKLIHSGRFLISTEDDKLLSMYDDREWFNEAVSVGVRFNSFHEKLGRKLCKMLLIKELLKPGWFQKYYWKDGFTASNWKYYHDAATQHLFFILNDLLATKGMVCG